ncbi:M28 family peptidase [candidate division KSB1 bacterium]
MQVIKILLSTFILVIFCSGPLSAQSVTQSNQAENPISEQNLRAHISFLSDDLLEGRGTGQRGMKLATKYIATQFELNGIEPAGENGTYFQTVPIIRRNAESLTDRNVLGIICGEIVDEYVFVTAHLDAFGIGREERGDNIYNGAVDNATGSAGLIEIGRAFKQMPDKPKRSIVLIALAAEEYGFLGANAYTADPLFPVNKTLAVVNIDEVLNHGKMSEIFVFGCTRSTLGEISEDIASKSGLKIADEGSFPMDAFGLSDQIAFAKAGIPGVLLYTGFKHENRPEGWSRQKFDEYYAERIHRPFDEYSEDWDMAGIIQVIRFGYELAFNISKSDEWPVWYEGQPFKKIREESLRKK